MKKREDFLSQGGSLLLSQSKTSERIYKFVILELDRMGPTQNISLNGFNTKFQRITDFYLTVFETDANTHFYYQKIDKFMFRIP
jgi:hypothetical protein